MHRQRIASTLAVLVTLLAPHTAPAQERGAAALGDAISSLGVTARVLMIGAHPDDEDTYLLAWLARAEHVETAYLSLTRGDGGQNLIGNELGEELGVIRTEELLAARRIDGARQYFTRAYDFGFSKSAEETFEHWPKDSILKDVVTAVRAFKPQVIIAVFSGTPRDGHGHHQVSGILAREAYALAADTMRFPRAATAGEGAWTPLKLYQTARFNPQQATLGFDVGEYDPLTGRTYAELSAESRSQHKSQGFGTLERRGSVMGYVRREQTRVGPADAGEEESIFDGIDTGWERLVNLVTERSARAALDSLPAATAAVRAAFDAFEPGKVIAPLARVQALLGRICGRNARIVEGSPPCLAFDPRHGIHRAAAGLSPDAERSLAEQARRLNRALLLASGVLVEATSSREIWPAPGSAPVELYLANRGEQAIRIHPFVRTPDVPATPTIYPSPARPSPSAPAPRPAAARPDTAPTRLVLRPETLPPDSALRKDVGVMLASTEPWWLATPRQGDMFAVPVDGIPDDERPLGPWVSVPLSVGDARMVATMPVIHRYGDPVRGEVQRPIAAVPAITLHLDREVEYAPANSAFDREVRVVVRSADSARTATVQLRVPDGLTAEPAAREVAFRTPGDVHTISFRVRGRLAPGRHEIAARARSGVDTFTSGYTTIDYEHIRPRRLHREATITLQAVDVTLPPGLTVGYITGVGDNVAPMLRQLGIPVTEIDPATMDRESLSRFRTVVVGPRAYEAQPALAERSQQLLDYVRNGGTVVAQYGQYEMQRPGIMPYPVELSRPHARVTEEDAPVRILAPQHPLLTAPNRITASDFEGWVQERSLYMPVEVAPEYGKLLSLNDPGEPANDNAILVAKYGSGVYVYTSLAFFRQLPAGNPGAARLFVNLLGAGMSLRP